MLTTVTYPPHCWIAAVLLFLYLLFFLLNYSQLNQRSALIMPLAVEKLNADSTFLLAFTPTFAPRKSLRRCAGAFTILIDPWLTGQASLYHPAFQVSHHTDHIAIQSLAELGPDLDLIVVSQDKPDHCHRETLCSLPHDTAAQIVASPAAAKKIKSWRHFDPGIVHTILPYSSDRPDDVLKITLPSYTSASAAGEITLAHIPTKRDIAGLHNAIGITYRPPASLLTSFESDDLDASNEMTRSMTPKMRKSKSLTRLRRKFSRSTLSDDLSRRQNSESPPPLPSPIAMYRDQQGRSHDLPSPPLTPDRLTRKDSALHSPPRPTTASSEWTAKRQEHTLSVIYTPHGISPDVLAPYVEHHLHARRALPLTALFHGITREQNPWFLGGTVANGAPGGLEIAKLTKPRYWIGAHDEWKENNGFATVWIKTRRFENDEVTALLMNSGVKDTTLWVGGVGERLWV